MLVEAILGLRVRSTESFESAGFMRAATLSHTLFMYFVLRRPAQVLQCFGCMVLLIEGWGVGGGGAARCSATGLESFGN